MPLQSGLELSVKEPATPAISCVQDVPVIFACCNHTGITGYLDRITAVSEALEKTVLLIDWYVDDPAQLEQLIICVQGADIPPVLDGIATGQCPTCSAVPHHPGCNCEHSQRANDTERFT